MSGNDRPSASRLRDTMNVTWVYRYRLPLCTGSAIMYGITLLGLGGLAAGAGHGTYVIIGLSSSPLSIFQDIGRAFAGPIYRGIVGLLLAKSADRQAWNIGFLLAMLLHYACL